MLQRREVSRERSYLLAHVVRRGRPARPLRRDRAPRVERIQRAPLGFGARHVRPDARVRLAPGTGSAVARLAIRPYPSELEETVECRGRRLLLRPIRPEDTPRHRQFLARITPRDLYTRFFAGVRELPAADLAHLTQIDYDRDMAFVAVAPDAAGAEEILGVVRASADPDNDAAEFAVLGRSDLKGQGLGTLLMRKLIRYCRERGTRELWGDVLSDNVAMLHLSNALGFKVRGTELNVETVALDLQRSRRQAERATTIPKGSRVKRPEAPGGPCGRRDSLLSTATWSSRKAGPPSRSGLKIKVELTGR